MPAPAARSPRPLLALLLAACDPAPESSSRPFAPESSEPAITTPRFAGRALELPTREPISSRVLLLGDGVFAADPFEPRPQSPGGPWYPETGWQFTRNFMQIDEQAYWLPITDGLLRIPRSRDMRWVRDDFHCPGWLLGERDDLLWCAEEPPDRDEVIVRELDKSGSSAPAEIARLPTLTERPSSLHRSYEDQGPFIIGDRVMMPIDSGFVSAELDGDGTLSFIALPRRPHAVVAHGDRVAWTDQEGTDLYSGQLPLAVVRREYADEDTRVTPEWVGDSLVFTLLGKDTAKLMRLTADGRLLELMDLPDRSHLIGGGERAWLLVDDHTMFWIDERSHGPAVAHGGRPVAHQIGSDAGLLYWMTVEHEGSAVHVSDVHRGSVVSLCGKRCNAAIAEDPAAFAARQAARSPRGSLGIVHANKPETLGPLGRDVVHAVVRHHGTINLLNDCYQAALASFPDLRGRFILDFEVDRRGRVANPSVAHESTLSGPLVRDCVFKVMRRLRFPTSSAAPTRVRLPLGFTLYPR